jgi:hypothetical protein
MSSVRIEETERTTWDLAKKEDGWFGKFKERTAPFIQRPN